MEDNKIWTAVTLDNSSQFTFREQGIVLSSMIIMRRKNLDAIAEFVKHYGGSICQLKDQSWQWTLQGQAVTPFLVGVLPFLKTKFQHAQLLLEFNAHLKERYDTGQKSKRLEPGDLTYRKEIVKKMKALNRKNATGTSPEISG
jgi:hypothetical protein